MAPPDLPHQSSCVTSQVIDFACGQRGYRQRPGHLNELDIKTVFPKSPASRATKTFRNATLKAE